MELLGVQPGSVTLFGPINDTNEARQRRDGQGPGDCRRHQLPSADEFGHGQQLRRPMSCGFLKRPDTPARLENRATDRHLKVAPERPGSITVSDQKSSFGAGSESTPRRSASAARPQVPPAKAEAVKDVTTASFAADVIQESRRAPVLVDFWAPWCGPLQAACPASREVVADSAGRRASGEDETSTNIRRGGPARHPCPFRRSSRSATVSRSTVSSAPCRNRRSEIS